MSRTVPTGRVVPVVLVVLVTLAGCNGTFDTESTDVTPTVTPAPVPTSEPTPAPEPRLAPGVTAGGVVNASALAAAHDAALEGRSFTVWRAVTYRAGNGTAIRRITSATHVGSNGRFRVTKRWNGTTALRREEYYDDGERLLVATTDTNNRTTYRRVLSASVADRSVVAGTGSEQIERVFVAAETRVDGRTERNGERVYRLVPASVRPDRSAIAGPINRSVSVRAHVSARGLVRSYTLRQTLSGEGSDRAAIVVSTRYTDIGSTSVERPTWYETAVAQTNGSGSNRTKAPARLAGE